MDQTRAPLGQPSATTRRRASIATLETDAGANSFYSATATADEDEGEDASASDMSQDLSASSDDDDDGSETASETMVVSAPDTSLISPGPVPKPVGGHHHHHHHVHHRPHGPGSSSSSTSLNTAFYRPDDTRSVTSVATVRPPPRSPPPVPSDLGRSWVAPDRPARIPSPTSTRPAPAAAVPARDFGSREGTAAAASVSLTRDAASSTNVADLQAQIARLQSQLAASSASPSTMAKRSSAGLFVRMLHASGRWLVRSVVAWIVLATVGRELRARNNKVYRVLEWLVKVAVGVESL
ncbi:hypothetical protein BCR44DRAFT_34266 [Catenaria anguillulae PL171]|uniref:Uncharacterized protein n=1 Tax=Catenaria anguillulae PL171 TaxID=765915 RepID=A0A1Y2HL15_9FUNG|nr:hypothetical protein BCR44DRAFT_34266 [Catenaria anguillulae PL171]